MTEPGVTTLTEQEARRRERRWFLLLGAAFLVVVVLCAVVGIRTVTGGLHLDAFTWAFALGIPLGVVVVTGVVLTTVVADRRRRGSPMPARSPLWDLTTRGGAADPVRQRRAAVLSLVSAVIVAGIAVVMPDPTARWLFAAVAVLYLGVAGYHAWLDRRARRSAARPDDEDVPAP